MTMNWTVETLNATVDRELEALPTDMRARFVHIYALIEAVGLERVGAPHIRHLTGPLWEMRMKGGTGISRALYVPSATSMWSSCGSSSRKPGRPRDARSIWR